jgi:hypothetical protein
MVSGVPVDVTADTAAAAREAAIREAQVTALNQLMRRMTLKENWSRLPHLDGYTVSSLVNSLEVTEERYSTTRYIAKVNVAFSPNGVLSVLRRQGIPFAQAPDSPLLVIPVYIRSGATELWKESNPWWEAWDKQDWSSSLIAFELPNRGQGGPSGEEIAGDQGAWRDEMTRRYGTSEIVVPVASWDTEGKLQLIVDMRRYGVAGDETDRLVFEQQPGEPPEALLIRAARDIGGALNNAWKQNAMMQEGPQSTFTAVLDIRNLRDLVQVRERLQRAPVVQTASLESVNTHRALFSITAAATPEQLSASLSQYGLDLIRGGEDWLIAPRR